jgi:argininosuccinate lyase
MDQAEAPKDRRAKLDAVLRDAWTEVTAVGLLQNTGEGYRLNLAEQGRFRLVREAWHCPLTRRLLDTTLRGQSPYLPRTWVGGAPVRLTMPTLAHPFPHVSGVAVAEVLRWLENDPDVLAARADEAGTGDDAAFLPGFTHLQQAQPVLLSHHLMAHAWALLRDVDRILDCLDRVDVSPLGAGALAGSSLPLDPDGTAADAGFGARFENSLDVTSDRDFAAETLFVLALCGVHLSRMGEEMVLWTTDEFGFARLDDQYATGSSMLPQKKNPDIAELARGKAGRVIGDLTGFLATLKSLPLAYNRDLQEDKEPVFDALDTVRLALGAMAGLYRTIEFRTDRMAQAASSPYAVATDLAEHLVARGMPFREAHGVVGALVRESLDGGAPLPDLVAESDHFGPEVQEWFVPGASARRRTTPGGAGPVPVAAQRVRLADQIAAARDSVADRVDVAQ